MTIFNSRWFVWWLVADFLLGALAYKLKSGFGLLAVFVILVLLLTGKIIALKRR